MKFFSIVWLLGASEFISGSHIPRDFPRVPGCLANNCLRAIRNSKRTYVTDCSAFMTRVQSTFTPTFTNTIITTQLRTSTFTQTLTATQTKSFSTTAISTVPVTVTSYVYTTDVTDLPKHKRAQETLPTYASPCPDIVSYSSACSCILNESGNSAVPATVTVAVPSVTSTVTSYSTTTISMTLVTISTSITITVSTQTVPTIVSTVTQTFTENRQAFKLQTNHTGYCLESQVSTTLDVIKFGTAAQGSVFKLNPVTSLVELPSGKFLCKLPSTSSTSIDAVNVQTMEEMVASGCKSLSCSIQLNTAANQNALMCNVPGTAYTDFGYFVTNGYSLLAMGQPGANWSGFNSGFPLALFIRST
ncbi:hypothetical protein TWF694_009408 [Orbilia ellipsospora]|uniref:Uncharacterized protein n=1 Tax=Orbilia ellipsospora TaxID=2528407 RepID=A0AAV9XBL0_9PEZI